MQIDRINTEKIVEMLKQEPCAILFSKALTDKQQTLSQIIKEYIPYSECPYFGSQFELLLAQCKGAADGNKYLASMRGEGKSSNSYLWNLTEMGTKHARPIAAGLLRLANDLDLTLFQIFGRGARNADYSADVGFYRKLADGATPAGNLTSCFSQYPHHRSDNHTQRMTYVRRLSQRIADVGLVTSQKGNLELTSTGRTVAQFIKSADSALQDGPELNQFTEDVKLVDYAATHRAIQRHILANVADD